jgi:hypothetical protein
MKTDDLFGARAPDLDALLHPSKAFRHPSDVLNDADLSLQEKRAILASWASDVCAIEAAPAWRRNPSGRVVSFDDIMDALRALDQLPGTAAGAADHRRKARRPDTDAGDQGAPLH